MVGRMERHLLGMVWSKSCLAEQGLLLSAVGIADL